MTETRKSVMARLRAITAAEGIDDAELCRRIGIRPSAWANFVSPRQKRIITRAVASKICDEFNVTLDWIYRGRSRGIPQEYIEAERRQAA
jgi:transcriptional regulator with XRE-family HTH domain